MWKVSYEGFVRYLDIYFKALILKDWRTIASTLKVVKTNFHAKTKKHYISYKNAFRLFTDLNFEELLSYLTSALSNMLLKNILCKTKNFQTSNKKCLSCVIFSCKFEKLLPYLKSELWNWSKCKVLSKKKKKNL